MMSAIESPENRASSCSSDSEILPMAPYTGTVVELYFEAVDWSKRGWVLMTDMRSCADALQAIGIAKTAKCVFHFVVASPLSRSLFLGSPRITQLRGDPHELVRRVNQVIR